MLRKIITLDKAYVVNWTPDDVCLLLKSKSITADSLIQSNKLNTNKLVRELFLLACRASLSSSDKATTLSNYAKAIKQISNDYEGLFRRRVMTEVTTMTENKKEISEDSAINTIDRLQARLFYLTTQYSVHPCIHIANHIVELLTSLCKHPNIELLPAQHYIYSQSINYWRSCLVKNSVPKTRAEFH
jgi:hypothetical protein